jgi:hypothetical protein
VIWGGGKSGLLSGMKNILVAVFFTGLGILAANDTNAANTEQPAPVTVIELFTSEGCSSCPPAEAKLRELVDRDDIIALAYHVDYWDYIGWADPYASPANTKRQRSYGLSLKNRTIYTPQMVFQGVFDTPGSRTGQIDDGYAAALTVPRVPVTMELGDGGMLNIEIGDGKANDANVILVTYVQRASSEVTRGENAGQYLEHRNVVQSFQRIGHWDDEAIKLTHARPAVGDEALGCAVLLQERTYGRIIGAAALNLPN